MLFQFVAVLIRPHDRPDAERDDREQDHEQRPNAAGRSVRGPRRRRRWRRRPAGGGSSISGGMSIRETYTGGGRLVGDAAHAASSPNASTSRSRSTPPTPDSRPTDSPGSTATSRDTSSRRSSLGWHVAVSRGGQLVHSSTAGHRDIAAELPFTDDTVVRMFSMTKPITSVAAMMLYEEGLLELKSPIVKWLPEFADTRVYRSGSFLAPVTEPQIEPIRVWHLLTHTSGLTYGFHNTHVTDAIYRRGGFEWGNPPGADLAECCDDCGRRCRSRSNRAASGTTACRPTCSGRLVEVVSGMPLDEFFRTRIFEPLGMTDTEFYVPRRVDGPFRHAVRPASRPPARPCRHPTRLGRASNKLPAMLGGGGGLVGTAHDYLRFAHMLLNRGELDGVRLLGTRTVDYMTRNHLPGNADLEAFGRPLVRRDQLRRCRLRARVLRRARRRREQGVAIRGRVLVGRCGQHDLLGRSRSTRSWRCSSPSSCRRAPIRSAHSSTSSSSRRSSTEADDEPAAPQSVLVIAPVSAPWTSVAYLPSTPVV